VCGLSCTLFLLTGKKSVSLVKFITMDLYKSDYQIIRFDQASQAYVCQWLEESYQMDDYIFESEFSAIAHVVDQQDNLLSDKLIIDAQHADFEITPDLHAWQEDEVLSYLLSRGLQKFAIVLDHQDVSELHDFEQIQTNKQPFFQVGYFPSVALANEWLS